ncbi:MAG: hypothetical protein ACRDTQ_13665, partial [Micromonosporaceae bacterium]
PVADGTEAPADDQGATDPAASDINENPITSGQADLSGDDQDDDQGLVPGLNLGTPMLGGMSII